MQKRHLDEFWALELESRKLVRQVVELCERRRLVRKFEANSVLGCFEHFVDDYDAWTISTSEDVLRDLRKVVTDLSILRRKALERDPFCEWALDIQQEYLRKLEMLESLEAIGDIWVEKDLEFYQQFSATWSCDSEVGCVRNDTTPSRIKFSV